MHSFRNLLSFLLSLTAAIAFAQDIPGPVIGGLENDAGFSITTTSDGGYMLAGSTRSYGDGSWDGYAVKLFEGGAIQWSQTYGWLHHDHFKSVIPLSDGYLFVGHIWDFGEERLDIYLLKTDLIGYTVFDKFYGTSSQDLGFDVQQSVTGGFLILGYTRGYEPHGDIFLIKTDEEGNEIWRNNYGTNYDDYAYSFVENEDGLITLFGSVGSYHHDVHYSFKTRSADWIIIDIDADGDEKGRKKFELVGHDFAGKILKHEDGGFYLFGSSQGYGAGSFDMMLMKIDESGSELWHKTFGGEDYEYGLSMDVNSDGDLYLFGSTKSFGQDGSPDYFLVKTNPEGEEIWSLTIGGKDIDYGNHLVATDDDGCAMIGQTKSFGSGGFDMLMVKVDEDGNIDYLVDGIDTAEQESLVVYPNPVRNLGRVLTNKNEDSYQMDIVSVNGASVGSYMLQSPNYSFNVENLPSGLYVYRITKPDQADFSLGGKLVIR